MANPGLDVRRRASREMTGEPAHSVKPNDVRGGRLCRAKGARDDEREPRGRRRHRGETRRGVLRCGHPFASDDQDAQEGDERKDERAEQARRVSESCPARLLGNEAPKTAASTLRYVSY